MTASPTAITSSSSPISSSSKWTSSAPARPTTTSPPSPKTTIGPASSKWTASRSNATTATPSKDLIKRDKANLDIFWLRDDSLGDSNDLPDPAILAAEIIEDLQAALDQFAQIAADLAAPEHS